jgi:putative nucleotidyltransferase with HDIG domain
VQSPSHPGLREHRGVGVDAVEAERQRIRARLASNALDLPILPDVVAGVLRAASDPDTDARKLAELVRTDAAIAAHVLRVANSSFFSRGTPVVSLQHAVSRLGIKTLRDILLIVTCDQKLFRSTSRGAEVREELRMSLATAAFAQEIARVCRRNVEGAFLAGLLHHVGRPVLYAELAAFEVVAGADVVTRLTDELHAEVGAEMLNLWQLPRELSLGVRFHHAPEEAKEAKGTASVVSVAADVARATLRHAGDLEVAALANHPLLSFFDLHPDDMAPVLARRADIASSLQGAS